MAAGATEATRWAAQSLGLLAAVCRPYRARCTIGRPLIEACRDHHGAAKAAWIVRTLTRGNVRGAERLPAAADPWRAYGAPRLVPVLQAA